MGAFLSYFWKETTNTQSSLDIESQIQMDYPYIMDNRTPTYDFENPNNDN